jgi:hypothetical protein
LTLAVPLRDLQSLEPVLDVDTQNRDARSVGTIELRSGDCPVFCIDESLAVLSNPRPEHRICAILAGGDAGPFGLICGAVEVLGSEGLASFGVPPCLFTAGSPLEGLALHGRRVLCRTSGAGLARFVTTGAFTQMLAELDPGMDEDLA